MEEYNDSLGKINKKYAIKKRRSDGIRKYFIHKYGVDPPVIIGDKMLEHHNENPSEIHFLSEEISLRAFKRKSYLLHTAFQ